MITIFVGTCDRTETLSRTIESFTRFDTPHELVLVDNGTRDPEARELLRSLRPEVRAVYRLPRCESLEEVTENFNHAIRREFDRRRSGEWYAVTDADVCFDKTAPEALDVYADLAKHLNTAVGSHLAVDDIPAWYPLRSRVLACESRVLYRDEMKWWEGVPYSWTQTDTTFHLFTKRRRFDRLRMDPVRVGPPYTARHLDWYLDVFNPSAENDVYLSSTRPVGSWGNSWVRSFFAAFKESEEAAFRFIMDEPLMENDLCNVCFIRSWCYQYGVGCEANYDTSIEWLRHASPVPNEQFWPYEKSWMKMIYDNDFSPLGWNA